MKRFLMLTLALLLMVQAAVLAEVPTKVYTDPDTGYQLPYPDLWRPLTRETIETLTEQLSSGEIVIEGMNEEVLKNLHSYMENVPLAMFQAPVGGDNVNIYYAQDERLKEYSLEQFLQESGEGILADLGGAFVDFTPLDRGSMLTAGDNTYVHFSGKGPIQGRNCETHQLYLLKGERMYIMTFTFFPGDGELTENFRNIMDTVIAGFVPA